MSKEFWIDVDSVRYYFDSQKEKDNFIDDLAESMHSRGFYVHSINYTFIPKHKFTEEVN